VYKRQIYQIAESNRIETFARIGMLYCIGSGQRDRADSDARGQVAGRGGRRGRQRVAAASAGHHVQRQGR